MSADKNLYRVWPDGWVQDASEEPYSWRSGFAKPSTLHHSCHVVLIQADPS